MADLFQELNASKHVRRPPQHMRRARGNLTYLQFVRLVENFWSQAHPGIPILPTGGNADAQYPCILYGLELRRSHDSDPKPRYRETINADDGSAVVVIGQRFVNIVSFTVTTETSTGGGHGAILAEEIIEAFEDFMQEMTPVLKEMGASELVYSRRYADSEYSRPSEGVVVRKVAYALTTEKIVTTEVERIEEMIVRAQVATQDFTSKRVASSFEYKPPKYYSFGNNVPFFYISEANIAENRITIPRSNFVVGDRLYLKALNGSDYTFPEHLDAGEYIVTNMYGEPFSSNYEYEISTEYNGELTQVTDFGPVDPGATPTDERIYHGMVYYLPYSDVSSEVVDKFTTQYFEGDVWDATPSL